MRALIFMVLLFPTVVLAQKSIVLSSVPKEVPKNKKWVIKTNKEFVVSTSQLSSQRGSICSVMINRDEKILNYVAEGANGAFGNPNKIYRIVISEVVNQLNDAYTVKAKFIIDHKVDMLDPSDIEKNGVKELVFYPGQLVSVNQCIENLQIFEFDN